MNPGISRFEALKGRGKMIIIGNKQLLLAITDLYTKDFPRSPVKKVTLAPKARVVSNHFLIDLKRLASIANGQVDI